MSVLALFKRPLHEPLVHFLLLGGLVFAADTWLRRESGDPRIIVVGPEVEAEARSIFRSAQGREPSPEELSVLRARWIDNEVLYREGLALRLDQGDATLRERVIFKALNVIESNLEVPKGDDATLRAWFDAHRARYDVPTRVDFVEAVLASNDRSEEACRRFVAQLDAGGDAAARSGLRVFKNRPRATIADSFGASFADALEQLPQRTWSVLSSKEGARVVRVEALTPGEPAAFEPLRDRVRADWEDEQAQKLRTSAVRELGKKYEVRVASAEGSS